MKNGKSLVLVLMASLIAGPVVTFASPEENMPPSKDAAEINGGNSMDRLIEANKKIENAVVSGYKAIENGVVSGYKGIEDGVVRGYKMIEKKFVDAFLTPDSNQNETGK
jgi:hypothetical protein